MTPSTCKQIRAAAHDQAQVTNASLLIVMTADLKAWKKEPKRYWQNAPQEVNDLLSGWMVPFYEGKEQLQRDEATKAPSLANGAWYSAEERMPATTCSSVITPKNSCVNQKEPPAVSGNRSNRPR